MSSEAAWKFVERVEGDEELRGRVTAAATGRPAEALAKVVAIGSEVGYLFTAEELKEATAGLTDEQLDQAAAGYEAWPCKWYVPELDSDSSAAQVIGGMPDLNAGSIASPERRKT